MLINTFVRNDKDIYVSMLPDYIAGQLDGFMSQGV